jgi:trigger factor
VEKQSMSISVNCSETAPCCLSVAVTIPAADTQKAYKAAIRKVGSEAKVPGFRPGKIPVPMLLQNFGPQINARVAEELIDAAISQVVKEQDLDFYTRPKFDSQDDLPLYVPELDYSFTFTVEVYPKITLPQYKGISVSRQETVVTDEEVEEYIQNILEQRGTFEPVQRPARHGDILQADYSADAPEEMLNDDQVKYLLKGENSWLMLREPELLPGIATALLNVSAGEKKDVEINFPADFRNEALQNKTYQFHFEIKEVKGKVTPVLDDKFLKELKLESEEQFRSAVKEMLKGRKDQSEDGKVREQLLQALLSGQDFPVPPSMLAQYKNTYQQETARMMAYQGLKQDDIKEKLQANESAAESQALTAARQEIILRQIGQAENIEVTNQMLANVVANFADKNGIPFSKALQKMRETGQIFTVSESIFRELALRTVQDAAQIEVIKAEQ